MADHSGPHVRLVLTGELDLATRDDLISAVVRALEQPMDQLELDVGGLAFCDSSGISGFLAARRIAADEDAKLVLVNPSSSMKGLLIETGLHDHLTGSSA